MKGDKIDGKITISRPTCGDGSEYISIRLRCESSRTRFLDLEMDYAEFAQALTGLSEVNCKIITRKLDRIGKTKETRPLEFMVPEGKHLDKSVAKDRATKEVPEGWVSDAYFNSTDSFFQKNGKYWARTTMSRWVDRSE